MLSRHVALVQAAIALLLAFCFTLGSSAASAQSRSTPFAALAFAPEDTAQPLPDIPALMKLVAVHEKADEAIRKQYIYRSVVTVVELDRQGVAKKTEVNSYDEFWINGVPVERLISKNGKPLTAEAKAKEDEKIDKEVAKARQRKDKAAAQGKETDAQGHEVISVGRFLELGSFSNPHRITLNGRPTIVVDFVGNPKAKTKDISEEVVRDLVGTIWVDEQDRDVARLEGHFLNDFKLGGGMLVNIHKGLEFSVVNVRVNDEVWLPQQIDGRGEARAMLFFKINGRVTAVSSDYRRFKTDSTIVGIGEGAGTGEKPVAQPMSMPPPAPN